MTRLDGVRAGKLDRRIATFFEADRWSSGELRELRIVELHPLAGRQAPFELLSSPPWGSKVDVHERGGLALLSNCAQRAPALVAPECESPVVEQPGGLFGERPRGWFGADEVPGLVGRDLEVVLAIDDGGRYACPSRGLGQFGCPESSGPSSSSARGPRVLPRRHRRRLAPAGSHRSHGGARPR